MTMVLSAVLAIASTSSDYNNWTAPSSPTLPRPADSAAVGYDSTTNRIWLVGSYDPYKFVSHQLMSYDIDSAVFTNYSATALSHPVEGQGDYYTQIGDILYMIDPTGNKLSTFNVNTAQFAYYYQNIDIPHTVFDDGCLASIDDALFVLGGYENTSYKNAKSVQILDLTTSTWIVSPEVGYLSEGRVWASCIVHPYNNALYAIGGCYSTDGYGARQPIEKLYVGDLAHISQYDWESIDSLPGALRDLRSLVYGNDIVSIGGYNSDNSGRNEVFVIDVTSDTVRLAGHAAFDCLRAGSIVVDNVLYSFGGYPNEKRFQYLEMHSLAPTIVTLTPTTGTPTTGEPTTEVLTTEVLITVAPTTVAPHWISVLIGCVLFVSCCLICFIARTRILNFARRIASCCSPDQGERNSSDRRLQSHDEIR
eukprot:986940_1